MTAHETYREQLLELAYGELGRREARALRDHLEGCPGCRAELARIAGTRQAMSGLPAEPAPERGESVLLAAAREAARERRRRPFLPSWIWGASVGAVGVAAVALVAVRLAGQVRAPASRPDETALVSRTAQEEAPRSDAAPTSPAPAPAPVAGPDTPEKESELALRRLESPRPQAAPKRKDADAFGGKGRADRGNASGELNAREPEPGGRPAGVASASPPAAGEAQAEVAKPAAPAAAPPPSQAPAAGAPAATGTQGGFARPPPGAAGLTADEAAPAPAEKKEVASARTRSAGEKAKADAFAPEDAVVRYERLRAAGELHASSTSFRDCPGESWREVERDGQGRVVKVTRRGVVDGTPFTAEQFYGEDGLLGAVRTRAGGTVQELRPGRPGAAAAPGVPRSALEPLRAADAGLDAPPRCE